MHCIAFTGSRISLISKKNIRYEGTLYSINESNLTVALQNVRSYGTEGREKLDPEASFVAPQDSVHPYLLFRGCDIKDLHVHESAAQEPPTDPAIMSAEAPPQQPAAAAPKAAVASEAAKQAATKAPSAAKGGDKNNRTTTANGPKQTGSGKANNQGNNNSKRQPQRKPNPAHQVGTGASLLNRKVRGTKDGGKISCSYLEVACIALLVGRLLV